MRTLYRAISGAALLVVLSACGGNSTEKVKKPEPERPIQAVFKNKTAVDVKNTLMGACSKEHLYIQPTLDEVTCIRHKQDDQREQMLTNLVDNDFAKQVTDNIKFVITQEGQNVKVVGNAYVQYLSPTSVGIEGTINVVRKNLLDNNSFSMMETLLKHAGATPG